MYKGKLVRTTTTTTRTLCGKSLGSVCHVQRSHSLYTRRMLRLWPMNEMHLSLSVPVFLRHRSPWPLNMTCLYCPHPLHGKVLSLRRVMSSIFIRFHAEKYVKWCNLFHLIRHLDMTKSLWPLSRTPPGGGGGGGVLPYISYIGMCRPKGYGF